MGRFGLSALVIVSAALMGALVNAEAREGGAARQVGPSLIATTTERASLITEGLNERPVLEYQSRDGGPAKVWMFANELVIAGPDSDARASHLYLNAALKRSKIPLQIVRQIPGRSIFLVRAISKDAIAPGAIAHEIEPLLQQGYQAEPNIAYRAQANQDLKGRELQPQWAMRNIGAIPGGFGQTPDADVDGYEALFEISRRYDATQPGPIVAVLDSGLDVSHPALVKALWMNPREIAGNNRDDDGNGYVDDVNGWDFLRNSGHVPDYTGHGTHVAGIIAASPANPAQYAAAFGLAPMARIMPLRVLTGMKPQLQFAPLFSVLEAHTYARAQGVDVINMSYVSYAYSSLLANETTLNFRAGIHQVAAAGNGVPEGAGIDINATPAFPCALLYVQCVGSTGPGDRLSSFSNYGAHPVGFSVAITAPGENILSTGPGGGYRLNSGTSMATPMVSAAFAAAKALYPQESNADRNLRVLGSADRLQGMAEKIVEGRRLNAYHALLVSHPNGSEQYVNNAYCSASIVDPESGMPVQRWRNRPYANSREPGIDGANAQTQFKICTADQLMHIRDEDLSSSFGLAQDIHFSQIGSVGVYPIGGQPRRPGEAPLPFTGSFAGHDHAIIGMKMVGGNIGGLFARISGKASITRLRLRQFEVSASDTAGALAARMDSGMVFRVEAEGTVSGGRVAGGLVGELTGGQLVSPYAEGRVTSTRTAGGIAGRVGDNQTRKGAFTNGYFNGTVEAPISGGLVGHLDREGWITGHALAVVHGQTAGGLVGKQSCGSLVDDAYAEGFIISTGEAGGIVGRIGDARIRNSYASVSYESPGKTRGNVAGVRLDAERGQENGPYVCTGTNQRPAPSSFTRTYYDIDASSWAGGTGGEGRLAEKLRDAKSFPPEWHGPNNRWIFRPGFMAALNSLPRSASEGAPEATPLNPDESARANVAK